MKISVANQVLKKASWIATLGAVVLSIAVVTRPRLLFAESPVNSPSQTPTAEAIPTVDEARDRARILHETIHGVLQVVHRDFFDEDAVHTLPSQSLEDVFLELERSFGVSIRWISVNAKPMNVDHEPRDNFEKRAAKALSTGKPEYESYEVGNEKEPGLYRHAGKIRLASQCLKCHVPNRTSTEDRLAGLTISMKVSGSGN